MPAAVWKPQARQTLFLKSPWYEVLFGGTKGPGKTDALLMEAIRQLRTPGYKAMIFRRTMPKLQEIIDRSHKWFTGYGKYNSQTHRWVFRTGRDTQPSYIGFSHCQRENDKYNHQGQEYHYIGFDQIEEFTETMYLFLMAQNRTSNPAIKCMIRATANPGNIGHLWVRKRFIDRLEPDGQPKWFKRDLLTDDDVEVPRGTVGAMSRAFIFSTVYDNKILCDADPDYVRRLEQLPLKQRQALLDGDWNAFEGQFFEFSQKANVMALDEWEWIRRNVPLTRFIGIDYGYKAPASVGWYALTPDDTLIRYRELYGEGMTYDVLGKRIVELSRDPDGHKEPIEYLVADPAIWGDKAHHYETPSTPAEPDDGQTSGESGADIMRETFDKYSHIGPLLKADNRRIIGWNRMRIWMKPYEDEDDGRVTARFKVVETCRHFIRTLPGLVHDEKIPEDLDTAGEDHAADECRYVMMSRPDASKPPSPPESRESQFWSRVEKDRQKYEKIRTGEDEEQDLSDEDDYEDIGDLIVEEDDDV